MNKSIGKHGGWLVLLGATACAGPRMVPPAEIASGSKVLDVADRSRASGALVDESFKLGGYSVTDVDRDWTSSSSASIGSYSKESIKTGYAYKLAAGKDSFAGKCASISKDKSLESGSVEITLDASSTLVCECDGPTAAMARVSGTDRSSGEVKLGDKRYNLTAVNETDMTNLAGGPAGYKVDNGETLSAAVEVLYPGRVWFTKDVSSEDQAAMSCVFAGLMLYVPPSDH